MARLVFENLTLEEADYLASWYEGCGEQDVEFFDKDTKEYKSLLTDVSREGGYKEVDEVNQTVTVFIRKSE